MITIQSRSFRVVYDDVLQALRSKAVLVDSGTWQGLSTSGKPEMQTYEVEDVVIEFPVGTTDLRYHQMQIGPNLPWADRHFELDRVSGHPRNPGLTWHEWPYALKADGFRELPGGQFNHSYAERYWPKYAGLAPGDQDGVPTPQQEKTAREGTGVEQGRFFPMEGIRYRYGDLDDVVDLLVKNPMTRGAYLPVTFPEDTGIVHGGRTPCTIGYLFRRRGDCLHVYYDIRSCDFIRHFKDDVYLTVRLLLWVLDRLADKGGEAWSPALVKPGRFVMHVGSLHVFRNDWRTIFPEEDQSQRLVPRSP